jgi:glycosyltransferase involved in cell wall biosynthesis
MEMFRDSAITLHPIQRTALHSVSAIFRMARVIRDGGYEIVNIQRSHDVIQSWSASALSGKTPALVYTVQVAEFLRSRFFLSRMDKIVTISRHIRDKILEFHRGMAARLTIVYYGINLEKFQAGKIRRGALRERFALQSGTPIIGTVGDLWKNQIEFLDALLLIRKSVPGARFALVASEKGTEQTFLFKRRVSALGLTDAVLWTGRLSKEDMLSFYADIDLAVSTHRNEGFGIWVLEALATGTPVVSVNAGGIRDSLEGCPAGVLVDGGPEEMAAEVIKILKNPSLRVRMSEAGPRWTAARFSKERMVNDYYRFFEDVIRGNKRVDS